MKKHCWALKINKTNRFVARIPTAHWEVPTTILFRTRKHADAWLIEQDNSYWQLRAKPMKVRVQIIETPY